MKSFIKIAILAALAAIGVCIAGVAPPAIAKDEQTTVVLVHDAFADGSARDKVVVAAWKTTPSWFIRSEQDHMIQPALQKAMAEKISAHLVNLATSHVPQLSQPARVASVILAAAAAAGQSK